MRIELLSDYCACSDLLSLFHLLYSGSAPVTYAEMHYERHISAIVASTISLQKDI